MKKRTTSPIDLTNEHRPSRRRRVNDLQRGPQRIVDLSNSSSSSAPMSRVLAINKVDPQQIFNFVKGGQFYIGSKDRKHLNKFVVVRLSRSSVWFKPLTESGILWFNNDYVTPWKDPIKVIIQDLTQRHELNGIWIDSINPNLEIVVNDADYNAFRVKQKLPRDIYSIVDEYLPPLDTTEYTSLWNMVEKMFSNETGDFKKQDLSQIEKDYWQNFSINKYWLVEELQVQDSPVWTSSRWFESKDHPMETIEIGRTFLNKYEDSFITPVTEEEEEKRLFDIYNFFNQYPELLQGYLTGNLYEFIFRSIYEKSSRPSSKLIEIIND